MLGKMAEQEEQQWPLPVRDAWDSTAPACQRPTASTEWSRVTKVPSKLEPRALSVPTMKFVVNSGQPQLQDLMDHITIPTFYLLENPVLDPKRKLPISMDYLQIKSM